jgi:Man1-Src1p-like protein/HeH/LEM domain-containing protein
MEEEDISYLQPDFNPTSLTVPRLRNVLLTHNIDYPSSAKKADLVQIFNDELKPRAKKLLAAQRRIQRSSRGIEDAASSIASTIDHEDVDDTIAQPSTSKRGRGRPRKTKQEYEDQDDAAVEPPPTTTRKKSKPVPSKSRERKTTASASRTTTPAPKKEPSDPATWRKFDDDSPFSAENPFQSGASSPPEMPASIKRRKTDGAVSGDDKKPKRKSQPRRRTDNPSVVSHTNTVVKMPVSAVSGTDDFDAGEEFEPSEQAELELERRSGNTAVVPVRRSRSNAGRGVVLPGTIAFLVAIFGVFGSLWTQEKFKVGYCGIGHPSDVIAGVEVPEWAESLRPTCEPCPQHGICYQNLRTECEKGFVLSSNPLSLGGLLPFTPTCEADGETPKRVKAVADRVVDELRERKSQAECGGTDREGNIVSSPEISEDLLKEQLSAKKRKGMTDEEFDSLWHDAMGEVEAREEVVIMTDEDG